MQKKFFAHSMGITMIFYKFATPYPFAVIAQLVEHRLPKPRVTGSSPAYRSLIISRLHFCGRLIYF